MKARKPIKKGDYCDIIYQLIVDTSEGEVLLQLIRTKEDRMDFRMLPKINGRFYATRALHITPASWFELFEVMQHDEVLSEYIPAWAKNRASKTKKRPVKTKAA